MRARNREINIFNMSLLDILTGMLGAFLFLMLGLLPYYAKVSKNKDIDPAEVEQLRNTVQQQKQQIDGLNKQIADLTKQLEELKKQAADNSGNPQYAQQLQQQIDQMTKERNFWQNSQRILTISSMWDVQDVDIDVLVMTPDGTIISPKTKDVVLGKKALYDGDDSHGPGYATRHEGLLIYLDKGGDYLVFYRVPKNANPASYAGLQASYMYSESQGMADNQGVIIHENGLAPAHGEMAAPGGLYAWTILTYDPDKMSITPKEVNPAKLPHGLIMPQGIPNTATPTPPVTSPHFPFDRTRPSSTQPPPAPTAQPTPTGGPPPPAPGF